MIVTIAYKLLLLNLPTYMIPLNSYSSADTKHCTYKLYLLFDFIITLKNIMIVVIIVLFTATISESAYILYYTLLFFVNYTDRLNNQLTLQIR